MCLIPKDTTLETTRASDLTLVEYALEPELESDPVSDTIPCPPPDWEELELE
jgi:hypothetical protein